ncbi:MAG: KGG domain-containing protein [Deltaproteobacteria bacterium]|nr:KGG domain-containing protein [Myxococcales bacterium]MDP3220250.1 KGG domain-containing protein [Deltaproteobacteria bacterium]
MTGGGSVNGSGGALGEATQAPRKKQRRGFAAMDSAKQKEIASKGGKASHAHGTGHEWNASSAREAGRKGGLASHGGRGKNAGKQ